ncbi:hypothetical protein J3Q64DRAFT_1773173 [Phycomyces blakesleeanus]|uniref:Uncharacterized protein n=1 Tax=Phycomyces blakesleeanus TaxID=4837 RepID=A0ABR3AM20_PHYBL
MALKATKQMDNSINTKKKTYRSPANLENYKHFFPSSFMYMYLYVFILYITIFIYFQPAYLRLIYIFLLSWLLFYFTLILH